MPLRLAFSAWAMRDLPPDQQIEIVRRAGYVGICLVSDHSAPLDALRITADEPLRQRLADAGPRRAARFSWKTTAEATLAALLEAQPGDLAQRSVDCVSIERVRAIRDLRSAVSHGRSWALAGFKRRRHTTG